MGSIHSCRIDTRSQPARLLRELIDAEPGTFVSIVDLNRTVRSAAIATVAASLRERLRGMGGYRTIHGTAVDVENRLDQGPEWDRASYYRLVYA